MNKLQTNIFRIIDANLNRSREGLRVCEEISRFILNSSKLTEELKKVRHSISTIGKDPVFDAELLAVSRDAEGDVGKNILLKSELKRGNCADIFSANMQRVKESLRALEEFSKLLDEGISIKFSRLRFKVYEIEKKAVKRVESLRHS